MILSKSVAAKEKISAFDPAEVQASNLRRAAPSAGAARLAAVEVLDFLSAEYRALYAASAATAFQAPLWMHHLHAQLAPRLDAKAHTIVVRDRESRRIEAVIPLVAQKSLGITMLQPADFGVCDSNAVVAANEMLEAMAGDEALIAAIDGLLSAGSLLIFRKVRADGFDAKRLFRKPVETSNDNAAYHCAVDDDFEDWRRKTMRKKFTKELNRLARQLERDVGPYEHRAVTEPAAIAEVFEFARRAREGRFADDLFATDDYFDFYRDYAIAAASSGEALTYASYLDGKPIAMLFGLTGDGDYHAVITASAMDDLKKFSPGLQIIYSVIKQRFDKGHRLFDMGLGDTGYKAHFRVDETALTNFTVSHSPLGAVVSGIYNNAKPMKNFLKRFAPKLR